MTGPRRIARQWCNEFRVKMMDRKPHAKPGFLPLFLSGMVLGAACLFGTQVANADAARVIPSAEAATR